MYESMHTRLARVPDEAILFPGHLYSADPSQSMGETRQWNYVFRPRSAEEWMAMFGSMSTSRTLTGGQHGSSLWGVAGRVAGGRDAAHRGLRGDDLAGR